MNRWIELFLKTTVVVSSSLFWAALSLFILFSADAWKSAAALSLLLSSFACVSTLALWVFFLAKQNSTHAVQFVDIKKAVKQKRDTLAPKNIQAEYGTSSDLQDYEGEGELDNYASSTVAQLLRSSGNKRPKEKLTDNFN